MTISPSKIIKFPSNNDISELERRDPKWVIILNYKFIKSANNKFFAVFARKEKLCAWIYQLDDIGSYREKYKIDEFPFEFDLRDFNNIAIDNEGKYMYLATTEDDRRTVYCFTTRFCSSVEYRHQWSVSLPDKIVDPGNAPYPVILVDNKKNIFVSDGNGKVFTFNHLSPESQKELLMEQHVDRVHDMILAKGGSLLFVLGYKGEMMNVGTIVSVDLRTIHINYAFQANIFRDGYTIANMFCSSTNLFYLDNKGVLHLHNIDSGVETFKTKALDEHIDLLHTDYEIFYKNKHLFISQDSRVFIFTLKGELISEIFIRGWTGSKVLDFSNEKVLFVLDRIGVRHYDLELNTKAKSSLDYKLTKDELDCEVYGFRDISYYPDQEQLHLISDRKEIIIDIASGKWKQVENDEVHDKKYLSKYLIRDKYLLAEFDEEHVFIRNLINGSNFELEFDFDVDDNAHSEFFVPYFSPDQRFFGLFIDNHIKIFDLERRQQLEDIATPVYVRNDTLSLSPCRAIAACHRIESENLKLFVWDLSNGQVLFSKNYSEFKEHDMEGCVHAFSPCGKYVLVVLADSIYQYDLKGDLILKRKNTGNKGSSTSGSIYFISEDGYFVTGACESQVWHIDKEEPLFYLSKDYYTYQKVIRLNNNRFVFWNKHDISVISTSVNTTPVLGSNGATPDWHNRNAIKQANELEVMYIRKEALERQKERKVAQRRGLEEERQERLESRRAEEEREEERAREAYRREEEEREEEQRRQREREEAEARRREEEEEAERLRKEREERERTYTLEEIWSQSAGSVRMNALHACYYHQADGRCSYREQDDWCTANGDHSYSTCWDTDSLDYCIKSEIGDKPRQY